MKELRSKIVCKCGNEKWKTVVKGEKYQCRKCGFVGVGTVVSPKA